MSLLAFIIIFSLLGSVASLIGGVFLLWKEKWAKKISIYLVSFAAGALLGAAFLDLLPEALEASGFELNLLFYSLLAIILFFIIEKLFLWYHCHDGECKIHTYSYMVLFGDGIHNFIDGMIIAASFLTNIHLGIVASLAVIFHEIPQEIGDFGVLLHSGMKKIKVLIYNLTAALMTLIGALLAYFFFSRLGGITTPLLFFAAGTFIYIASSDLIPEIHKDPKRSKAFLQIFMFIIGILVIWTSGKLL